MAVMYNSFKSVEKDTNNFIVEVELPGIDPSNVKITYDDEGRVYLNDYALAVPNTKYYDCSEAKAELKHGLLKIVVPYIKPVRTEIPLTV